MYVFILDLLYYTGDLSYVFYLPYLFHLGILEEFTKRLYTSIPPKKQAQPIEIFLR